MQLNSMTFQSTVRPGGSSNGCTTFERCFSDFRIDEQSQVTTFNLSHSPAHAFKERSRNILGHPYSYRRPDDFQCRQ